MKNRIIAIAVAFSILIATLLFAPLQTSTHVCVSPSLVISTMTTSAVAMTAHNHTPNNHNIQEQAVALKKNHDFANSADYMEGLTAISKRSIYCGDAERRGCAKLNI